MRVPCPAARMIAAIGALAMISPCHGEVTNALASGTAYAMMTMISRRRVVDHHHDRLLAAENLHQRVGLGPGDLDHVVLVAMLERLRLPAHDQRRDEDIAPRALLHVFVFVLFC